MVARGAGHGVFDVRNREGRKHHGDARITKGGDAPSQLEDGTSPLAEDDGTDKSGNGNDGGRQHEENKWQQDAQRVEIEAKDVQRHRRHKDGGRQRPKDDGAPGGVEEDGQEFFMAQGSAGGRARIAEGSRLESKGGRRGFPWRGKRAEAGSKVWEMRAKPEGVGSVKREWAERFMGGQKDARRKGMAWQPESQTTLTKPICSGENAAAEAERTKSGRKSERKMGRNLFTAQRAAGGHQGTGYLDRLLGWRNIIGQIACFRGCWIGEARGST